MRLILILLFLPLPLWAETFRLATWGEQFGGRGPGLLLQDITRKTPFILAAAAVIAEAQPDFLVLTAFDYDADARAAQSFAELCGFDYFAALPSRSGFGTGQDRDGDGRFHEAEDAESYGRFPGAGAIAIFSHRSFAVEQVFFEGAGLWRIIGEGLPPLVTASMQAPLREDAPNAREIEALITELRHRPAIFLGRTQLDPTQGRGMREKMRLLAPDPAPPTAFWESGRAMRLDYILDFRGREEGKFGQFEADLGASRRASFLWLDLTF